MELNILAVPPLVGFVASVPPLATGRIPVTSVVRSIVAGTCMIVVKSSIVRRSSYR
jgi:hypothetical protein